MNKQLIKDNMEAFTHWLNGGKLLYKHRDTEIWKDVNEQHKWGEPELLYVIDDKYVEFRKALAESRTVQFNSNFPSKTPEAWIDIAKIDTHNTPLSYLRIKPDKPKHKLYKLNKIPKYNCFSNDNMKTAYYAEGDGAFHGYCTEGHYAGQREPNKNAMYYISDRYGNPIAEPKFKVGDWVVNTTTTKPYKPYIFESNREITLPAYSHIELWQPQPGEWCIFISKDDPTDVALGKFTGMEDGLYTSSAVSGSRWPHCEPFIGDLPQNLKD